MLLYNIKQKPQSVQHLHSEHRQRQSPRDIQADKRGWYTLSVCHTVDDKSEGLTHCKELKSSIIKQ